MSAGEIKSLFRCQNPLSGWLIYPMVEFGVVRLPFVEHVKHGGQQPASDSDSGFLTATTLLEGKIFVFECCMLL